MGMMKIPSKMKTSATAAIIKLSMLPLKVFITLPLQIERNPTFKKCKKLSLRHSVMQKAETYFFRVMKIYGENEEKKDQNDIFGVLIVTELKELSKWKKNLTKIKTQNPQNMQIVDEGPQNRKK